MFDFFIENIYLFAIIIVLTVVILIYLMTGRSSRSYRYRSYRRYSRRYYTNDSECEDERDCVNFSAFAPSILSPGSKFIMDIFAHLRNQETDVIMWAYRRHQDALVGQKTAIPVAKGVSITIRLDIPYLEVREPIDTIVWNGEPANASYQIAVPSDLPTGTYTGTAKIASDGMAFARLDLSFLIAETPVQSCRAVHTKNNFIRNAFASYASEDRSDVLARIQGMKKIAPLLEIFIDVLSLRSGDDWEEKLEAHVPSKDAFFLFWSENAAQSEWVEREWRMALAYKGISYIDPVPLSDPRDVPPPGELEALHFNDAYLAYIQYQHMKDRQRNASA